MAKSKSTSPPPVSDVKAADAVNEIYDSLGQAHATLDLLVSLLSIDACAGEHIESLHDGSLAAAVHCAMLRIEEAMEAADSMQSYGGSHGRE